MRTDMNRLAIGVIAIILTVAALMRAEEILAPVALALTAGIVMSPLSDWWERVKLPRVLGAMASLVVALCVIVAGAALLYPVVERLVTMAPKVWADLRETVSAMRDMAESVESIKEDIAIAVDSKAVAAPAAPAAEADMPIPSVTDALFLAPSILAQVLIFAGTLFFFVLTRTEIYDWAARFLASGDQPPAQVSMRLMRAERRVSQYFVTISLINLGLGAATAALLYALGLPGAVVFGLLASLANFILYLGPAVVVVTLAYAGIAAFDGLYAILPALGFAGLNILEGQFVTPALVGQSLKVNPLIVFLSVVFGMWLWGAPGGIVAIPLLLWIHAVVEGRDTEAGLVGIAPAARL